MIGLYIAIGILAFLLLIFLIWFYGVGIFFLNFALKRKDRTKEEMTWPKNKDGVTYIIDEDWLKNGNFKDLTMTSFDGNHLHAYMYEVKDSNIYIVFSHGYHGIWLEASTQCHLLSQKLNANVVMIDQRAHGKSDGKYFTMGFKEGKDVALWTKYIEEMNPRAKIILYGQSMGAATIFFASSDPNLSECVKCLITDSGYASIYDQFNYIAKKITKGKSTFLIMFPGRKIMKMVTGLDLKKDLPINSLKQNNLPIYFIHGESDTIVPFENLDICYNAIKEDVPKLKYSVKQADHTLSFYYNQEYFIDSIVDFVKRYI